MSIRRRLLLALLTGALAVPALAVDEAALGIKVRKQSGINFVSGGNGDEAKSFREIANRYPVQMFFMVGGQHVDMSEIAVRVIDVKGEAQVEAVSEGSMFFVNPPSGRWTFEATWKGQTLTRTKDLTGRRYLVIDYDFKPQP